MMLTLVALLAVIWVAARRSGRRPDGVAAASAIAALLVCSPVLSGQYVSWLLPWAAVSVLEEEGDLIFAATLVVGILTVIPNALVSHLFLFRAVTFCRDLLLLGIAAIPAVAMLRRRGEAALREVALPDA
jgi:hypothetical protein